MANLTFDQLPFVAQIVAAIVAGVLLIALWGIISLCWKVPRLMSAKANYWEAKERLINAQAEMIERSVQRTSA